MRSAFIVAAGAALLVTATLVAVAGVPGRAGPARPAAGGPVPAAARAASPGAFGPTDVAWLQLLTPMTDQAVRLAALARTRAADPRLRTLAAAVATGHGAELSRLRALEQRAGVAGTDVHAGHDMPGMTTAAEYTAAEQASAGAFDRIVEDRMREYLDQSVRLAGSEGANGSDPAVKQLAADLARTRAAELGELDRLAAGPS
ncbi:DUF305 domain-containing protein [Kitasatospora sp. NPDC059571]|uniref:DUF305 domain-containing protein n=1 Tax=Kitasatospora sp. NPDC059571 TaxID=3346871 RepID=UPI00368C1221